MHSRTMIKSVTEQRADFYRSNRYTSLLNCNCSGVDHGDRKEYQIEEHSKQDDTSRGYGADKSLAILSADTTI